MNKHKTCTIQNVHYFTVQLAVDQIKESQIVDDEVLLNQGMSSETGQGLRWSLLLRSKAVLPLANRTVGV